MNWLAMVSASIQLVLALVRYMEKNQIISETEQIERARIINKINADLIAAAGVRNEIAQLSDEELDRYAQDRGWFRD